MKNDSKTFEPTVAQQQSAQDKYPKKIGKKKLSSFYDMFFNSFEWSSNKLSASFDGIAAFSGAAIGAIANFFTGIFGDNTKRPEIQKILDLQTKQKEHIQQTERTLQDVEIRIKIGREQTASLLNYVQGIEALSKIGSYVDYDAHRMSADTPEMSMTDIPKNLICPITQLVFIDPVTIKSRQSDGTFFHQTYEREAIVNWKNECLTKDQDFTDPLTRLPIVNDPRTALTDEIKEEMVKQFWKRSSTKAVTTAPQWQTKISGTIAEASIPSCVEFDISSSPRLSGLG